MHLSKKFGINPDNRIIATSPALNLSFMVTKQ